MNGWDVIVIGAGISGLSTALTLHQQGARVCVLEKNPRSQEASWAGGGIICPLYAWRYPDAVVALARLGMQQYPDFIQNVASRVDPQYQRYGMHIHDPLDANYPTQTVINERLNRFNIRFEWQSNATLWLPDIASVRNPRLLTALTQTLQDSGVPIYYQHRVVDIQHQDHRFNHLLVDNGQTVKPMHADACVLCSGAWSNAFAGILPSDTIYPVRGQMLRVCPTEPLAQIVMQDGVYAIPRADGGVIIGSTVEHAGFDKHVDIQRQKQLQATAAQMHPSISTATPTHRWAGLRPASLDEHPIIGPHPKITGLWLNTGGFRNGLAMAPAASTLLVDLMQQRPTTLSPSPYTPERL